VADDRWKRVKLTPQLAREVCECTAPEVLVLKQAKAEFARLK